MSRIDFDAHQALRDNAIFMSGEAHGEMRGYRKGYAKAMAKARRVAGWALALTLLAAGAVALLSGVAL